MDDDALCGSAPSALLEYNVTENLIEKLNLDFGTKASVAFYPI